MKTIICTLFHKIDTIDKSHFVDVVTGYSVGKFHCKKCNNTFLAENKRDFFRVKISE